MAVDAVTIAFRTGMHVIDVAQRVEASDTWDGSWSIIVPGSGSGEVAVERFVQETVSLHPIYESLVFPQLCSSIHRANRDAGLETAFD